MKMKLQSSLFYCGALLLLTSTKEKLSPGPQTVFANSDETYCAGPKTDYASGQLIFCNPGEYCGINKVTGEFQGCVTADQCPDDVDDAKKETIVCSGTKPSCCCQTIFDGSNADASKECNNLKNPNDDTQWKKGCSLPALRNFPFCQVNPTSKVWCSREFAGIVTNENTCGPGKLCGISKASGELHQCVESTDCPDSATASKEIVCEPGKPYCCCQVHTPKGMKPVGPDCNNFKEDYPIWKQACGLKELRDLDVCKGDPPSTTTTTTTTSTTEEPTGKTEGSTAVTPGVTKSEDFMSKDTSERNVVIAVIVILVIIVLLVIGGLVYYFCVKRRATGVPWVYQQQQQQVYQMSTIPVT